MGKNRSPATFRALNGKTCFRLLFKIMFGVRQGSVLSPILFALYIDDINDSAVLFPGCHIILYADDILLISPSVMMLNRLLHTCETELNDIDMDINFRKSSCIRIWPRNDATCASIVSLNDHVIHWMLRFAI